MRNSKQLKLSHFRTIRVGAAAGRVSWWGILWVPEALAEFTCQRRIITAKKRHSSSITAFLVPNSMWSGQSSSSSYNKASQKAQFGPSCPVTPEQRFSCVAEAKIHSSSCNHQETCRSIRYIVPPCPAFPEFPIAQYCASAVCLLNVS